MTTDPTDTAARIHEAQHHTETNMATETRQIIDTYLRASVACPQCQGTGDWVEADFHTGEAVQRPCPSPHTQITITKLGIDPPQSRSQLRRYKAQGAIEILYADLNRIGVQWSDFPYLTDIDEGIILPFPPGWTVA